MVSIREELQSGRSVSEAFFQEKSIELPTGTLLCGTVDSERAEAAVPTINERPHFYPGQKPRVRSLPRETHRLPLVLILRHLEKMSSLTPGIPILFPKSLTRTESRWLYIIGWQLGNCLQGLTFPKEWEICFLLGFLMHKSGAIYLLENNEVGQEWDKYVSQRNCLEYV